MIRNFITVAFAGFLLAGCLPTEESTGGSNRPAGSTEAAAEAAAAAEVGM